MPDRIVVGRIKKKMIWANSSPRHKTSNSPELVKFMKYGSFLIFWCIFCRSLRTVFRLFEIKMNSFLIRHNFPLAYILSFQKSILVLRKYLELQSYLTKSGHRSHYFLLISTSEPKHCREILQISNPNFSHIIYN